MKPSRLFLILFSVLTATPAVADEILIYKYASTRPWTLYACLRPDAARGSQAPPVPKNTLSGTYTQTEYWVVNKTTNKYAVLTYSASSYQGAVDKTYSYDPADVRSFTRSVTTDEEGTIGEVPSISYLPAVKFGTYNLSLHFGDLYQGEGEEGGAYSYTEQANLLGLAKPLSVSPGLTFQKVAPSLKGPYIYSHDYEEATGANGDPLRTLYFEKAATQSLTLDAAATKRANTGGPLIPYEGGTAVSRGSIAYGLRVAGLQLEAIGYDFAD